VVKQSKTNSPLTAIPSSPIKAPRFISFLTREVFSPISTTLSASTNRASPTKPGAAPHPPCLSAARPTIPLECPPDNTAFGLAHFSALLPARRSTPANGSLILSAKNSLTLPSPPLTALNSSAGIPAQPKNHSNFTAAQYEGDAVSRALDSVTLEDHYMQRFGLTREFIRTYLSPDLGGGSGLGADALSAFSEYAADLLHPLRKKWAKPCKCFQAATPRSPASSSKP